jgi:hypothetical protein
MLQRVDLNNVFSPMNRHQRFRAVKVKGFEVTYLKEDADGMGSLSD